MNDTMIWYLYSKLDLNLSCAKDFRNQGSVVYKLKKIVESNIFSVQFIKIISHHEKWAIT